MWRCLLIFSLPSMTFEKVIAVMLLAVLAGCATEAKLNAQLDSWTGRPVIELVRQDGPPQRIVDGPSGHKWYVYRIYEESYTAPSRIKRDQLTGQAKVHEGPTFVDYCDVSFEVDTRETIVSWHKKGNHCASR